MTNTQIAEEHFHWATDGRPGHRNAPPCHCDTPTLAHRPGRYGWEDDDSVTQPEPEPERITVQYDLPGTHPVLTVGISDQARVLIGERIGDSRAGVNWITRLGDDAPVDGLQQVLEQVRVTQARIARQVHPSDLRMALRAELASRAGRWATLDEIVGAFTIDRQSLIRELARMRDDGEVVFTGPRYRLVDRQAGS